MSKPNHAVTIGNVTFANDAPLALIAGPCQLESRQHAFDMAGALKEMTGKLGIGLVYKSSYDKANRTSLGATRGAGLEASLPIFADLRKEFGLPILTFIDTPGAYPGIGAEERGQSEAIARNLLEMAERRVPISCNVVGEGGSGGALAIGVGDVTNILEYATYSVISPEGCASILWKDARKAKDAAEQLGLTAKRLHELGLVDKVLREPIGGAHRKPKQMAKRLKAVLLNELDALEGVPVDQLLQRRYERLRGYGAYDTAS